MDLPCILPALQHRLVAAQSADETPCKALKDALHYCGVHAGGTDASSTAPLSNLLLAHPDSSTVLAAAAYASGHPCALGVLLARLLSCSIAHISQLLVTVRASDWAAAIIRLHSAACSGTLPQASRSAAHQAFSTLVKALLTARTAPNPQPGPQRQQQQAPKGALPLQALRQAWEGPADIVGNGTSDGPTSPTSAEGAALLAAVVAVVDCEVFPRSLGRSWLVSELGRVLLSASGGSGSQHREQQQGQEQGQADLGVELEATAGWGAAMAAFAAAVELEALLQAVQAAAWQGAVHVERAAALLTAAAALEQAAAAAIKLWVQHQAEAALQQHDIGALQGLMLLQRALLPGLTKQQPGAAPAAKQESLQQQYGSWFGSVLLAAHQAPHLQFLLQQLLIPMLPEDGIFWVQAQSEALAALIGASQQQQKQQQQQQPQPQPHQQLPASSVQLVGEYLAMCQQRLHGEQQQQQQQQNGHPNRHSGSTNGGAASKSAPGSNLLKGREIVGALLAEFGAGGGQLRAATLNAMQAKASNVFTKGELHNMLAPALLEPCGNPAVAAQRVELMQYLCQQFGQRGDTHISPLFRPEVVVQYQRHCLQAQLEGATLQQLADRAPLLLLAPDNSGSASASGGGGISGHQLLDRMGRLMGEQLGAQQAEQRAAADGSSVSGTVSSTVSLDLLVGQLLSTWTAAYCASHSTSSRESGSSSAPVGSPSAAAVAAHVLSIAHQHPQLHAPLLAGVRRSLLRSAADDRQLEAAAMLATVAGALVLPARDYPQRQHQHHPSSSNSGIITNAASLQPLFVWRQLQDACHNSGAASPAEVPGPVWLQRLLAGLPGQGGAAGATTHALRVAATHLRCLPHFRSSALLPEYTPDHARSCSSGVGGGCGGADLLLSWRQPAAASLAAACPSYGGEFAASLVCPACPAALRLLQWQQLRAAVARQLLGWGCDAGSGAASRAGCGARAAKRARLSSGTAPEQPVAAARERLGDPHDCLPSKQCAPLTAAAGKLTLTHFLRLEAASLAAGDDGTSDTADTLPPQRPATDAVFRLCCSLFVGSSGPSDGSLDSDGRSIGDGALPRGAQPSLDCLVERLGVVGSGGGSGPAAELVDTAGLAAAAARDPSQPEKVLMVPDTDDEEEEEAAREAREGDGRAPAARHPTTAAVAAASFSACDLSVLEGLVAAVATTLLHTADAAEQQQPEQQRRQHVAAAAALAVCQKACAQVLRLLAGRLRPGVTVGKLLPALLAGVVQHCKQLWAAQAEARQQAHQWMDGRQQQQLQPQGPQALAGEQQQAQKQSVAALASGLLLELLPLPLGSSLELAQQAQQLAALAAAVDWGLSKAACASGLGLVDRLEAALAT